VDKRAVKAEPPEKGASEPAQDVDERVRRSKEAILRVTSELLSEAGFGGVSVDEVSRRSGVAKTTIYRHWPTRSALLIEACAQLGTKPTIPDTGTLKGDLTTLSLELAERLRTARWPAVLPSIIDAAERDPELAGVHSRLHADRTMPFRIVIDRAKERGELARNYDGARLIATVIGPLFYRRWFSREALDQKFVKSVVEIALRI
jgi:AcrR family transcriptional regulator